MRRKNTGFTLVELLITLTIIAILAAVGLIIFSTALKQGRDSKRQSDLRAVQSALEQYYSDQGFYPNSSDNPLAANKPLTSCTGNPNVCPSQPKTYLNSVPSDPTNDDIKYFYSYMPGGCDISGNNCSSYCLYANLENAIHDKPDACVGILFNFAVIPP